MVAQDRARQPALRLDRVPRRPRRTAAGTVLAPARAIATTASGSDVHAGQLGLSPRAICTMIAASVASIAAATSRFIGRARVVTRA